MKNFFQSKGFKELLRIIIAVSIGLTLGFIFTLFVSDDPIGAYKSFLLGPLSRMNRIGDWLEESLTLILLGLAVTIVFSASQFYIGVEGQMILGALVSGSVALFVPLPPVWRILLAFAAAIVSACLWGFIPALLKAYLNANELVTSLMLNTVMMKLYEYMLSNFIKPPDFGALRSESIGEEFRLPTFIPDLPFLSNARELWMKNTNITIMVYIIIAAVIGVYLLLYKTPFGYEIRTVGSNKKFARYGGINVKKTIVLSITISGIFAGLAGVHIALAIQHKLSVGMSVGLGFEGINVAILSRLNPLAVPVAGLLYGYLRAGADIMERSSDVSRELILVVQAMVLLMVTAETLIPIAQKRIDRKYDEDEIKEGETNVA